MEVVLQSVSFIDYDDECDGLALHNKHAVKYIDKASITLAPGSITAIIGSPKETRHLLELIGLRKRTGYIAGDIYHDNVIRKHKTKYRDIAYIRDFDSHYFDYLTVFDFLMWAGLLRLHLNLDECCLRAREVALEVDLNPLLWVKELDAGQRILLALAAELVNSPTLICMECPLDFKNESHAVGVARSLTRVAHRKTLSTTIVFTALGPSYSVFQFVDQVVVQFQNNILYYSGYLLDQNYDKESSPLSSEDADKCRHILAGVSREILRSGYGTSYCSTATTVSCKEYDRSTAIQELRFRLQHCVAELAAVGAKGVPGEGAPLNDTTYSSRSRQLDTCHLKTHPYLREISSLVTRAWACLRSNPILMGVGVLRFVVSGIILGVSAMNAGNKAEYLEDDDDWFLHDDDLTNDDSFAITSTLFFITAVILLGHTFAVPYMNSHIRMIKMEISTGVHHPVSAWISILLYDWPVQLLGSIFLCVIVRAFLKLQGNSNSFYSVVVMCALCSSSLASAIAACYKSAYKATQVFMASSSLALLFCGYLQLLPSIPSFLRWGSKLSFARWTFQALMLSSFQESRSGRAYLDKYGFDEEHVSDCVVWMLLWVVALQFVLILNLYPFQRRELYTEAWKYVKVTSRSFKDTQSDSNLTSLLNNESGHTNPTILGDSDIFCRSSEETVDGTYEPPNISGEVEREGTSASCPVPLSDAKKTSLWFSNVSLRVKSPNTTSGTEVVLKGMSGGVYPGEMCCILDAKEEGSAGVLLQILCGKASTGGIVDGEIRISDKYLRQGDTIHNAVYVMEGDSVSHSFLTVRESLRYAALLRRTDQKSCPAVVNLLQCRSMRKLISKRTEESERTDLIDFSDEDMVGATGDVENKVNEALQLYDLGGVADVIIGREKHRRISPSQLRCLTIATEGINSPGLFFIQNPFYRLDWYHANRVCKVLKSLKDGGRSILCALSRPTDEEFVYFDHLLLLNKGLLMYSGEACHAQRHFDNIGFQSCPTQSILSYLLDICHEQAFYSSAGTTAASIAGKKSRLLTAEDLANIRCSMDPTGSRRKPGVSFSSARPLTGITNSLLPQGTPEDPEMMENGRSHTYGPVIRRGDAPIGPSARVLLRRRTITALRNWRMVCIYMGRSIIVSCLLGLLWYKIDDGDVEARIMLSSVAYVYIVGSLADLFDGTHRRQTDYMRERSAGATTAAAYWWADGTPVAIHTLPQAFVFSTPFYMLAGLRSGLGPFLYYCFIVFASLYCNIGLMYLVSAIAKRPRVSQVVFLGLLVPLQIMFSGSVVYLSTLSTWLQWGALMNPMHYFLAGVFENEFEDNSSALGSGAYEHLKNEYGFMANSRTALIALVCIGYGYRLLWLMSLKYREILQQRHVLHKVVKSARLKVQNLVATGLRLSRSRNERREPDSNYDAFQDFDSDSRTMSAAMSHQSVLNQLYSQELPQPGVPSRVGHNRATVLKSTSRDRLDSLDANSRL